VVHAGGGSLNNTVQGTITGTANGVDVWGGNVTLINAGTISGCAYAALFAGGGNDTLIIDPGAVLVGKAGGSLATSALVLASAGSTGTTSGLGTKFTGFKMITKNATAKWTLTGANSQGEACSR
jgi:hypothetical protein